MTETATKPIGALLPGIVDSGIDETALIELSTTPAALLDLSTIQGRIGDATMGLLREIATADLPLPACCDDEHFARCMKSLNILPRRADETGGTLRLKLYQAKLGGFDSGALSYLVSRGLERFQFFPTIKECLDLLAGFPNRSRDSDRREKARHLVRWEMQARLDETLAAMRDREFSQAEIDALPEQWKQIAEARGLLWLWPDGRFTVKRDTTAMTPEDAEAERERVRAMMAEWAAMRAGMEDGDAPAEPVRERAA